MEGGRGVGGWIGLSTRAGHGTEWHSGTSVWARDPILGRHWPVLHGPYGGECGRPREPLADAASGATLDLPALRRPADTVRATTPILEPCRARLSGTAPQIGVEVEVDSDVSASDELGSLWRVICHDDPVTTMDFVVDVFTGVFRLPLARAFERMLCVHRSGSAVVGHWPESAARKKVERARALARAEGFPLCFTIERDA